MCRFKTCFFLVWIIKGIKFLARILGAFYLSTIHRGLGTRLRPTGTLEHPGSVTPCSAKSCWTRLHTLVHHIHYRSSATWPIIDHYDPRLEFFSFILKTERLNRKFWSGPTNCAGISSLVPVRHKLDSEIQRWIVHVTFRLNVSHPFDSLDIFIPFRLFIQLTDTHGLMKFIVLF